MKRLRRLAWVLAVALTTTLGLYGHADSKPWWMRGVDSNEGDFLAPDAAFRVSARVDGQAVRVRWIIADGYYLYRHRMEIHAESPDVVMAEPSFPAGILKTDPYLGTQEIFEQQVEGAASFTRSDGGAHPLEIKVTYQGCATAGLCYPPITKVLFPAGPPTAGVGTAALPRGAPHPWEPVAIAAGGLAFLIAGFVLRKGRRLDLPVP